ncbi:MAG: Fur family transcriptional regulator [Pseudomonadota bacterium]
MTRQTNAFTPHNHGICVADALARAEALCSARGMRLTPVRRRVLEILLESHKALGAYEVLARLDGEGHGSQPTVAYRALDFLVGLGLAHKIARLSAFVACLKPDCHRSPAFLICRACRSVAEAEFDAADQALGMLADQSGFAVEALVVEAEGLCPACQDVV